MSALEPRGTLLHYTREEVVARALMAIVAVPTPPPGAPSDAGGRPIHYRLEYPNGGDHPGLPIDLVHGGAPGWAYGERTPVKDCIGHALDCYGIDRKTVDGKWWSCAAIFNDATGARSAWIKVDEDRALAGDLMVNPDHIGVVVRPRLFWTTADSDNDGKPEDHRLDILVSDCSPRHGRETAVGLGGRWARDVIIVRHVSRG